MKIAVVGSGFTGLSAALQLSRNNHSVVIFEKEAKPGGLAGTFMLNNWHWHLEKHYHHWFTNDDYALSLIEDLGLKKHLVFPKTLTSVYYSEVSYPFNSPIDVLNFYPLSVLDRIRTGLVLLYLKILPPQLAIKLEKTSACEWLKSWFGDSAYKILWKPLLLGKFGKYMKIVNMAWFWARIKKRTPSLGYLEGGYHKLVEAIVADIRKHGGKFYFETSFSKQLLDKYDKVIVTTPSSVFAEIFSAKVTSIPHLHALNLLLVTREKILPDVYWLNINDRRFPFIAVVQQTNLIDSKYYSNQHIAWIANYLPSNHPYLKMSKEQLFKLYLPYLKKINPSFNFELCTLNFELFFGPFAQPVFPIDYSKIKPDFTTPIPNVYLANMDMVYPWDRGTNYAIELGERIANLIDSKKI